MIVLDDWMRQVENLKIACAAIRGKQILKQCWFLWEKLAGAVFHSGRKTSFKYSDEQSKMLLAIAWLRKHFPKYKLTYRSVREYYALHSELIEEAFDRFVAGEIPPPRAKPEVTEVTLVKVKLCCDKIANREISRGCFTKWKLHLGIPKYQKTVESGLASLLVFLATWRQNHPTSKLPSKSRLLFMMSQGVCSRIAIENMSSSVQQHEWAMRGCWGRDLPKYLASLGYQIKTKTLYTWKRYSARRFYSVSDLREWLAIAVSKSEARFNRKSPQVYSNTFI